jgi:hypothetical protein
VSKYDLKRGIEIVDINNVNNLLWKLSEVDDTILSDLSLTLSLVKKQKESDLCYQSLEISLAPEVKVWLKKSIIKSLKKLKEKDSEGKEKFLVGDYNHEIKKQDHIAKYDVTGKGLEDKLNKMLTSIATPDPLFEEADTNFQMVKISYGTEHAYFCFYGGVKKSTSRKKAVFRNTNRFEFVNHTVIDVGGNFSFIIVGMNIFILNITNFENAFDYRDHITELRDENLKEITSMPFFEGEDSNKEKFLNSCKTFIHSRGLAQIKPETISVLQDKFKERCDELSIIRRSAPSDPEQKKLYIEKNGSLWQLLEYINVEEYKITYKEGDNPTPLIHFFADKIAKSFLTEDVRVVTAYE